MISDEQDPRSPTDALRRLGYPPRGSGVGSRRGPCSVRADPGEVRDVEGQAFFDDTQRLTLLALLLENVGVDQAVRLGDPEVWRAAVRELG